MFPSIVYGSVSRRGGEFPAPEMPRPSSAGCVRKPAGVFSADAFSLKSPSAGACHPEDAPISRGRRRLDLRHSISLIPKQPLRILVEDHFFRFIAVRKRQDSFNQSLDVGHPGPVAAKDETVLVLLQPRE